MKEKIEKLRKDFETALQSLSDLKALSEIEQQFFSRASGRLTELMNDLKNLSSEQKKEFGKLINDTKNELQQLLTQKQQEVKQKEMAAIEQTEAIDVTAPKLPPSESGHLHPITQIENTLDDLFTSMGFIVYDGPELESDYYNFEALNYTQSHPARESQDTFFIKDHPTWLMRTQTSSLQIRGPEKFGVPLRLVVPGRCFRNEATDARHEHTFYQLEGVVIDKGINFAHMKGTLEIVAKHLYGEETQLRLRPKYYPFVEPGVNGEVTCFLCKGDGCRVCKKTGWLEIFGAGPMHPQVLRRSGVDPKKYQGYAFGFGIERLVMLKYGVKDIRHFESGDLRFVSQF